MVQIMHFRELKQGDYNKRILVSVWNKDLSTQ